jgi:hypothetical protein
MKRARFTEVQIIGVLKEAEAGAKTTDLARRQRDIGSNDLQMEGRIWRSGGLRGQAAAVAGGGEREAEAALADTVLDNAALKDFLSKRMVTPAAMREAVAHLQASLGMSERRACRVVGADRKSVRYRSTRPDDADLRERLRALAAERRRFGYRRLHILLRRDGVLVNRKKTQRLYTEEGLTVRKRRSRRRAVGARAAPPVLALPNQRWSLELGALRLPFSASLRIRPRSDGLRAPVPCAEHRRRCDTRVPGGGAGHLDLGATCGPGADRADQASWQARDNRQRQWHRTDL